MHNGYLAELIIKKEFGQESTQESVRGQFIEDLDFFQIERQRMIKEFQTLSVDDDIRILQKEMLI